MEEQDTITTPPTSRSGPATTSVTEPPVETSDPSVPIHSYALRTRPITHPRGSVGTRGLPTQVGSTRLESRGDAILDVQFPQLPAVEEVAAAAFPFPTLSEVADFSGTDGIYPSPPQLSPEVVTHSTTTAIITSSSPTTSPSTTSFSPATVSCPPGQLTMAGETTSSTSSHLVLIEGQ